MTVDVRTMAECRERRRDRQRDIISIYKKPCVSFTLNIPGPVKDTELYRKIHQAGIDELEHVFADKIIFREINGGITGPEAFFSIDLPSGSIKKKTVEIEETHSLGRIFDMDVITRGGDSLSRRDFTGTPRKCLICGEEAAGCARSRRHSLEELLRKIESIASGL